MPGDFNLQPGIPGGCDSMSTLGDGSESIQIESK